MDWAKAIEINQQALIRIIAALFAMLGLENGGVAERLPQVFHDAVLRILRPAESAVRRLIVIAARGLVLETAVVRPMPKGLARGDRKSGGRNSFKLFDARKRFFFGPPKRPCAKVGPRVIVWHDNSPLVPLFRPRPVEAPVPVVVPESGVNMLPLCRRLGAISSALGDLPRQARRLLRWQARRDMLERPRFKDPLRPGPPPGHRKKPCEDVDWVLNECHALARDATAGNTS